MRFVLVAAASLFATATFAQDTTVIHRHDPGSTTVIEKRKVETTGSVGCETTTKQRTNEFGDTTTKKKIEC
jgi:hypothetical protein